jgi:hypothetical protein
LWWECLRCLAESWISILWRLLEATWGESTRRKTAWCL